MEHVSQVLTAEGTSQENRMPHSYFRRSFLVFRIAVLSEYILALLALYRMATRSSGSLSGFDQFLIGGLILACFCQFKTAAAAGTYAGLIEIRRNDS